MNASQKISQANAIAQAALHQAVRTNEHLPTSLPASLISIEGRVAIVQIEADNHALLPRLRVPLLESEYIRTPLQPGCKGMIIGAHLTLGMMTGLGTRRPQMGERPGNLSAAVFVPLSHAQWDRRNQDFLNLYGVTGVYAVNRHDGPASVTMTDDTITLQHGENTHAVLSGDSITLQSNGAVITLSNGNVSITGNLTINGQPYKGHTHTNGNNGSPTGSVIT